MLREKGREGWKRRDIGVIINHEGNKTSVRLGGGSLWL